MADNRTISQLEAEGYPWIGCECCKGTVWVPFKMLRERLPMLSAMTLDQLGAKMKCDKCGKRPERYYPANQNDTPRVCSKLVHGHVGLLQPIYQRFLLGIDLRGKRCNDSFVEHPQLVDRH